MSNYGKHSHVSMHTEQHIQRAHQMCARSTLQDNNRFKMQWLKHMVQLCLIRRAHCLLGRLLLLCQRLDLSFISLHYITMHTHSHKLNIQMLTNDRHHIRAFSPFSLQKSFRISPKFVVLFQLPSMCIVCVLIEKQMSQTRCQNALLCDALMIVLIN